MKNVKITIKDIEGKTIFSFDAKGNTMRNTVKEAVMRGVSLEKAYLPYSELCCTDLKGANLKDADLRFAGLGGIDLSGADLRGANLKGAHLKDADLSYANLDKAILRGAILNRAVLKGANLRGVNLRDAMLDEADLKDANLEGADFYDVFLNEAKNVPDLPLACPSDGEFIGWKKIEYYHEEYEGGFLVKLLIPEDAKRCSATTEKCRCDKARVMEITNIVTGENVDVITNVNRYPYIKYEVGKMVYPDSFDENRWNECSHGIHFFIDKQDALDY